MAEIKLVIGDPKSKRCFQKVVSDSKFLMGKKIGDKFKGENIDLTGYEFEITGGSDKSGFPMRLDIPGSARKKVLITGGVGLNSNRKGMRKRKTIVGNTIGEMISQVNVKVIKPGKKALSEDDEAPAAEEGKEKAPVKQPKPEVSVKEESLKEEKTGEQKKDMKEEKPAKEETKEVKE